MKTFFFFIFLVIVNCLSAQPSIQWQKCLGGSDYEQATSIRQTSDSGYIVTGHVLSQDGDVSGNHGVFDFWVVKLTQLGSIQWQKTLGGSNHDWPYSIRQTTDGGYITVGHTASIDGDVSDNHGGIDAWVVKLDSLGAIQWQKTLGGSKNDDATSVELVQDGGYIIAGESNSNDGDVSENHGYSDFWVLKLNSAGDIEWQKSLGGSSNERALAIKCTAEGGYIVVGETLSNNGDVMGNNGDSDLWVVKLDILGDIEWQNALGGVGLDVASDVVETSDGFVVCGYEGSYNTGDVTGHHGASDYWIVKLSKTGELLWQKAYGGSESDQARSIVQTSDGMFLVAGETKSSNGDVGAINGIQVIWALKLNQEGELIWKKTLGGTQGDGCFSIQQTNDNGYVLGGFTWSNDGDALGNHGECDFWIVKLSPESSPTLTPSTTQLQIFPNPTPNKVSLKTPQNEPLLSLQITDLQGRALSRQYRPEAEIDLSTLPNGFYLVSAITAEGRVFVGKVQKVE